MQTRRQANRPPGGDVEGEVMIASELLQLLGLILVALALGVAAGGVSFCLIAGREEELF